MMKKETVAKFYLQYRLYIFPAIVALSSLFLIIFAIYPQTAKLIENQKAAGDLINKSKFLTTKVAALESYNEEDLSSKVGVALNAFPVYKDYERILGLLQGLATESGFTISSIALGNTAGQAGNSNSFGIKLEIKGPKALFQNLLTNLENSPRIMRISNIDITATQASGAVDASLVLEVLYSPMPQNFGSIDSPLPELTQKEEELLASFAERSLVASPSAAQPSQRGKTNPFE